MGIIVDRLKKVCKTFVAREYFQLDGGFCGGERMGCLGNVLWFVFGGCISGLSWLLVGCLWSITIIGLPIGLQCFKFATVSFCPFGKDVYYGGGAVSLIMNIIWLAVSGIALAVEHVTFGCILCITIIGIPFGLQHFKLAKLALMPFGASVR